MKGAVERPLFHKMHAIREEEEPEGSENSPELGLGLRNETPAA